MTVSQTPRERVWNTSRQIQPVHVPYHRAYALYQSRLVVVCGVLFGGSACRCRGSSCRVARQWYRPVA